MRCDKILERHTPNSRHRTGGPRKYRDLIESRFDITKVIRIERSADENDIANKWCDFSLGTVSKLFEQGTLDALKTLAKEIMISESIQAEKASCKRNNDIRKHSGRSSQLDLFISYAKKQGANYDLIQSAESVKLPVLWDQLIRGGYIQLT